MRFSMGKICIYLLLALLAGCNKQDPKDIIKVGAISGPETRLLEVARHVAKSKYGLKIQVVEFNDYTLPNTALADGSIDANVFQHQPYLDATIAAKDYNLAAIGKTFVYPMGLYSKKFDTIESLPENAKIAIPNDPSNEARALLLLQKAAIIKLKPKSEIKLSVADITYNPKHIKIIALDAAQLPHAFDDVDLAAINTNYAMLAGLLPSRDALFIEDKSSPYANIVAVRKADKHNSKLKQLVEALHSQDVLTTADELFHGEAIPAWETL
ncbi:MAG: metQ [Gammaproteobacteria bacterium]|jgi:D-methionine transport system substrate-binding protein|nr:metQ [Gammaproteobacteria bacterium]